MLNKVERMYKQPPYAQFPRPEYEHRIRRLKEEMADAKLDAIVMWDEVNIRYFTGFYSNHFPPVTVCPAVLIVAIDKEPVMSVPNFFQGVVEGFTYIEDIRVQHDPHVTANLRGLPKEIAGLTIDLMGKSKGRVGIEGGLTGGMTIPRPLNDIDAFRAALSDCELVYAADQIWNVRMIKSMMEVEALKDACMADVRAYHDLVADFEWGWTEKDVGLFVRQRLLEYAENCRPCLCMASRREVFMADIPAWDEGIPLMPGDRLVLEPLPEVKGYWGSSGRTFHMGPPPEDEIRKIQVLDRGREVAAELTKPGVTTGEIMDAINDTLQDGGLHCSLDQGGHGVGIHGQEPPAIALGEKFVVKEDMVLALECWMFEATPEGHHRVYGGEDYVHVTRDGCDLLPTFPTDIMHLGD
jgi:Xaa-Pro aminopeptidase